MRPVAARGAQVVASEVEAVGGQQLVGALVVEPRPFELEEQQRRLDLRPALLDLLEQRAARRVGGVAGEVEHRVRAGAPELLLDRLQLAHRGDEPGPVELGDLAGVGRGERVGASLRLGDHRLYGGFGVVSAAVQQRVEVPGDILEVKRGHTRKLAMKRVC